MADDPTKHAIDVIAHRVIATSVQTEWGYYSEIGEHDWLAVVARVGQLVESFEPDLETFNAAYEHLEHRAQEVES
jgi:hypothetical protein